MKPTNIRQFFTKFPDDETCLEHLFNVRFGQGHKCSKCQKSSNWYRIKAEQAFSCQWCGNHLHPMVGTIFQKSSTPLQLWFFAIFLFTTTRNGVSSKELQRQLGVTYKTAWRMGHKIREHMAAIDGDEPLDGVVEVDETFVGGHREGGQGGKGKVVLLGMAERGGDVHTVVVPDRKSKTLIPEIVKTVEVGSEVHTDEHRAYQILSETDDYDHHTVDHSKKEYVGPSGETTNMIEGFFSQLKRTIQGTHIWVSEKHLGKYAKECEYRFNRRTSPALMLPELLTTFPKPE
jgi:transposase-like protein